jgi:urate oxidase/2-oxo-4-hydroxy-4-carboxy-5-ureidoimidazoline decarboxylase
LNTFKSGWKRNYYGKGDVIVYRLNRDGNVPEGRSPVFGANVLMLIYGEAFWPTYTEGDNTGLIATDSMKNFIQRETLQFAGYDLEGLCHFLAEKFLHKYPRTEGVQVSAAEIPFRNSPGGTAAFEPAGTEKATACVELRREGDAMELVEVKSGLKGFRLLRLGGSSFAGFVRDEYTTLPEIKDRPLHMWLDLDWTYCGAGTGYSEGAITARVRRMTHEVFQGFESGSIQEIIYQLGTRILAELPQIAEVNLEAENRTWDMVAESGDAVGVFTDPRPPYGCLGLSLRR